MFFSAEVITAEYIEDDYDPRPDSGITVRDQHFPRNSLWANDLKLKSGDLDGDGKPELLTYISDEQKKIEGMVIVRFKDGLPYIEKLVFPTANRRLDNITLGDVDNDGKEEIIEASFSGTLKIYKWDGNKAILTSKYP